MDEFKKYMQHHSEEMNFEEPGEAVWKNISVATRKQKRSFKIIPLIRFAAAACFILLVGLVWLYVNNKKGDKIEIAQNPENPIKVTQPKQAELKLAETPKDSVMAVANNIAKTLKPVLPTTKSSVKKESSQVAAVEKPAVPLWQNIDNSFGELVNMQLKQVRSLPLYAEGPEYYSEFKKHFQQLEQDEKELKKTISNNGMSNENLSELVNIYQEKLNLLKMLQNEINKTNSRFKQNNRSDSTNKINYLNI